MIKFFVLTGLNAEIGRGQGFVRTLSSFNLGHSGLNDNDEGPCHTLQHNSPALIGIRMWFRTVMDVFVFQPAGVANLAADFDVGFALNESGIKPWDRYFPIEEIVSIYKVYRKCLCVLGWEHAYTHGKSVLPAHVCARK